MMEFSINSSNTVQNYEYFLSLYDRTWNFWRSVEEISSHEKISCCAKMSLLKINDSIAYSVATKKI